MQTAEKPDTGAGRPGELVPGDESRRKPGEQPFVSGPAQQIALCVDLDGALVKCDTLLDGMCQFARRRPLELWRLPLWLAAGRARLKAEIARRAPLDVTRLPYNSALLRFLRSERRAGRPIYLTTGADDSLAERVAAHLGIFNGVLASDGVTNLTREKKLARIEGRFSSFDYVGNSTADLPLLMRAHLAMVANPTRGLLAALRDRGKPVARSFLDRPSTLRTVLKAIRVHQWAKNILLLAPLLFSHNLRSRPVASVALAFVCFSFMASANYLVNDLLDIENDRRHPAKRFRPFASGDLPVSAGILLALALACASLALLPLLARAFAFWLGVYLLITSAYSIYLKRIAIVDVLVLSGLYTLRLLAGGAATGTLISPWLAGFSSFLFLSLAMVKRFSELENLRERGGAAMHGRGYRVADLEQIRAFGTASAYASVLVFTLYITRPDVDALYKHPVRLWLIVPLMVYWITRVWLIASRGELDDDPVIFALRDGISLAVGLCVVAVAIFAL
ncbi:MAG TPA: UbiA family prenyltransferase [Terracidiphilus sp.]|nr:UbiA family prenyltransferase [Terracidiphilus sp.]